MPIQSISIYLNAVVAVVAFVHASVRPLVRDSIYENPIEKSPPAYRLLTQKQIHLPNKYRNEKKLK